MVKKLLAVATLLTSLMPFGSHASIIYSASGLTGSFTTENFDTNSGNYTAAATQFSGMTWSANTFVNNTYNTNFPNITVSSISNFTSDCCFDPTSFTFNTVLSELAFAFVSNPQSTTFAAYLGGVLQESATLATDYSGNFVKITDISFDEVRMTSVGNNDAYIIDQMQRKAAEVPEPGTLALMGLALAGAAALRRRRAA